MKLDSIQILRGENISQKVVACGTKGLTFLMSKRSVGTEKKTRRSSIWR